MWRAAKHLHLGHPRDLRHHRFEQRVSEVVQLVLRQPGRGQRDEKDRDLRGIELEILRRTGQRRQVDRSSIDRRLHVARRAVRGARKLEAYAHRGDALAGVAVHVIDAWNLAQMAFQRRQHSARHGLRIGTRLADRYIHAGEIQRWQCGNAEQHIGDEASQGQANRQQRRANRATNQGRKYVHGAPRCGRCGRHSIAVSRTTRIARRKGRERFAKSCVLYASRARFANVPRVCPCRKARASKAAPPFPSPTGRRWRVATDEGLAWHETPRSHRTLTLGEQGFQSRATPAIQLCCTW